MAKFSSASLVFERIASPPDSASSLDSQRLNDPYSFSSSEIRKWTLMKPCRGFINANAWSANASTSERTPDLVLNVNFRAYILILRRFAERECLLYITLKTCVGVLLSVSNWNGSRNRQQLVAKSPAYVVKPAACLKSLKSISRQRTLRYEQVITRSTAGSYPPSADTPILFDLAVIKNSTIAVEFFFDISGLIDGNRFYQWLHNYLSRSTDTPWLIRNTIFRPMFYESASEIGSLPSTQVTSALSPNHLHNPGQNFHGYRPSAWCDLPGR